MNQDLKRLIDIYGVKEWHHERMEEQDLQLRKFFSNKKTCILWALLGVTLLWVTPVQVLSFVVLLCAGVLLVAEIVIEVGSKLRVKRKLTSMERVSCPTRELEE